MKKLVLLLLLLSYSAAFSQNAFVKLYASEKAEMPTSIVQMNNSNIFAIRYSDEIFGYMGSSRVIKTNIAGETEAEFVYELPGYSFYTISTIVPVSEGEFITVAQCKSETSTNCQIGVIKFDTSLNVIWEKKYTFNKPLITNISALQNTSGNLVIGAGINTETYPMNYSLVFLEITTDGDSVKSRYRTDGNPMLTDIFSLMEINGQYKAFVNGYASYVPYQGFSEILQLDHDFNLIGITATPYWIEEYMTADKNNDSSYYLTGKAYSTPTHYDVAITKLSNTEDSIAYNHAGKPGTAVDYSGWLKCMSVATSNSIFTGGTGNDNGLFYSCNTINKVLMLSNYDSLLNCRWTRFYGSDTACLTMSTLQSTSDGGCIMGGIVFSPSHPENLFDAVIIKVDSLGVLTGLNNNNQIFTHEAIVYPNPGTDYLIVQSGPQINGSLFTLCDTQGKQILKTNLYSPMENIPVPNVSHGTYLWKVMYKGKIVGEGNWIRE